jgi:hypothetical protein
VPESGAFLHHVYRDHSAHHLNILTTMRDDAVGESQDGASPSIMKKRKEVKAAQFFTG